MKNATSRSALANPHPAIGRVPGDWQPELPAFAAVRLPAARRSPGPCPSRGYSFVRPANVQGGIGLDRLMMGLARRQRAVAGVSPQQVGIPGPYAMLWRACSLPCKGEAAPQGPGCLRDPMDRARSTAIIGWRADRKGEN